jgi:hypothetical protein
LQEKVKKLGNKFLIFINSNYTGNYFCGNIEKYAGLDLCFSIPVLYLLGKEISVACTNVTFAKDG